MKPERNDITEKSESMKPHRIKNQLGFTVTEVMLAVICSSVLMVGLYQIFHSQQFNYIAQGYAIELQQNLRSGIYLLNRDIRFARYNPTEAESKFGFTANLDDYNIFSDTQDTEIDYKTDFDKIAFYIDKNEDGEFQLDIDPDNTDDAYDLTFPYHDFSQ